MNQFNGLYSMWLWIKTQFKMLFKFHAKYFRTGLETWTFIHSFIYSYSVPAVHRRTAMPAWSSIGASCRGALYRIWQAQTSLHHLAVTSNLLHWTVWLLSTTIYIGVSRSALLHPLIVCQALRLPLLLAILCPRTFSRAEI
jgi:hypothetical protein